MKHKKPEISILQSAESTNAVMLDRVLNGDVIDFQVIYALQQTHGKGQGTHSWVSEPEKNLTFSMYFNGKKMNSELIFYVNKAVALALTEFTRTCIKHKEVFIKWPNDIICEGGKIAGILIENIFQEAALHSIIGIGYNLNQKEFPDMENKAISLSNITSKTYHVQKKLQIITGMVQKQLLRVRNNELEAISSEYDLQLLFRDVKMKFSANNEEFEGQIVGTDSWGRLEILSSNDGTKKFYEHGRIKYITSYF